MRIRLFRANPSLVQASIAVAGVAVFRRTSSALKSVWVSSLLFGPRSRDFGGLDCKRLGRVVCRLRHEAFCHVRGRMLDAVANGAAEIRHCVCLKHRGSNRITGIKERSIRSVVGVRASTARFGVVRTNTKCSGDAVIDTRIRRSLDHRPSHVHPQTRDLCQSPLSIHIQLKETSLVLDSRLHAINVVRL